MMGEDGLPKPAPRPREDIMVARVTSGSNLGYICGQLKSYLSLWEHFVKDKNLRLTAGLPGEKPRDLTRKEVAKICIAYYIELAHSNNYYVVYPSKSGEPPLDMDMVVNRIMLNKEVAAVIALEY